jgi:hypothetical protein
VRSELAGNDGSHDWHHIERVRNLAISLAEVAFCRFSLFLKGALSRRKKFQI